MFRYVVELFQISAMHITSPSHLAPYTSNARGCAYTRVLAFGGRPAFNGNGKATTYPLKGCAMREKYGSLSFFKFLNPQIHANLHCLYGALLE